MNNQQIWGTVLSALGTAFLSVGSALLVNNALEANSNNQASNN